MEGQENYYTVTLTKYYIHRFHSTSTQYVLCTFFYVGNPMQFLKIIYRVAQKNVYTLYS